MGRRTLAEIVGQQQNYTQTQSLETDSDSEIHYIEEEAQKARTSGMSNSQISRIPRLEIEEIS